MVRLSCEKCGRAGQYKKQNFIARYGADIRLPDLRWEITKCSRYGQMHDNCQVRYLPRIEYVPVSEKIFNPAPAWARRIETIGRHA